jgi:hypothetical protein
MASDLLAPRLVGRILHVFFLGLLANEEERPTGRMASDTIDTVSTAKCICWDGLAF